jgi:spermidine synthase
MNSLGRHILVEFIGCHSDVLDDVSLIEKAMTEAAQRAGATVINSTFHHFSPQGVSGVVVIQESHLAIHTWPEYQYAAVDLFTCGDSVDPWISFDHLKIAFGAKNHSALEMYRGSLSLMSRVDFQPKMRITESQAGTAISRTLWFTDKDTNQAISLRYNGEPLFNEKSPYQKVQVFDSASYGKMLTVGTAIMCTERDEFHYHEMLVHPVLQLHGNPEQVLVIGGGDGGTLREVFRYPSVKECTLVEIDEAVIRAAKEHFPKMAKEFGNPKLKLHIADGIEFVKKSPQGKYDVILVDGADPVGPAEGLFSEDFFRNCKMALKPEGYLACQGESPMFHERAFVDLHHCLKNIFGSGSAHVSLFHAPTYPSGMWSVHVASLNPFDPKKLMRPERTHEFAESQGLKYYNLNLHQATFSLPTFVRDMLQHPK